MFSPFCRRYATIVLICLLIGASRGGVLSLVFGARKGAFWIEPLSRQTSRLQGPNFADMAEQLKPAVVNISTT
jgi:S1-C subfamily serine protease